MRDFDRKGVQWALRLSPHYYNTMEEVDRVFEVLGENPIYRFKPVSGLTRWTRLDWYYLPFHPVNHGNPVKNSRKNE